MVAILTGDIINSEARNPKKWVALLSAYFKTLGKSPSAWEIYRGDEFQLKINDPNLAILTAIHIKVLLKTLNGLDVRIGIGLGEEEYKTKKITQSNGSAYVNSGRIFEQTKTKKINLLIKSGADSFDSTLNLMLKLALTFMDDWTQVSAETLQCMLENPGKSQQKIAKMLKVSQSTISQRLSRANYDVVLELNRYFQTELKKLL